MFQHSKVGAVDVVSGSLPLDAKNVQQAQHVCSKCMGKGQPQIVIDLEGVSLIDSAGLEFLLDTFDECTRRGGAVLLASPNPLCCDILNATGLSEKFLFFDDVDSAVGSFSR
jgi:anti-sigma B factor antagonist